MLNYVLELYEAGHVARFHAEPFVAGTQDVAAHSFGVALLLTILHPSPSANLLKAAIWHDLSERRTGDVPSPLKRSSPQLLAALEQAERAVENRLGLWVELSQEEKVWLRYCDMLEAGLHGYFLVCKGNMAAMGVLEHVSAALETYIIPPGCPDFSSWLIGKATMVNHDLGAQLNDRANKHKGDLCQT